MASQNLVNNLDPIQHFAPQTLTTTASSTAVDALGVESILITVNVGAGTINSTDSSTWTVTEGATSAAADAVAASQLAAVDSWDYLLDITGDQNTVKQFQFYPSKRYYKITHTRASSFSALVGVTAHHAMLHQPSST
jgi:hypothetical protein